MMDLDKLEKVAAAIGPIGTFALLLFCAVSRPMTGVVARR